MTDNNKSRTRRIEMNEIIYRWAQLYKEPAKLLINHLINEKGYSQSEIARILGVSRQAVNQTYIKEGGRNE